MQERVIKMQRSWKKLGLTDGLEVRMGISTGFCTVGNFGSDLRLDYTVLGSPVNLAARLQGIAKAGNVVIDENTKNIIGEEIDFSAYETITPKGFARPVNTFQVKGFKNNEIGQFGRKLSHTGKRIEINVIDSSDIRAAIEELKQIQVKFEEDFELNEKDKQ
tara:strand:- start:51 stop:536 length:486 start_codon:yes stop_codon:yes gene_type:complete